MRCPHCDEPTLQGAKSCLACGEPVVRLAPPVTPVAPRDADEPEIGKSRAFTSPLEELAALPISPPPVSRAPDAAMPSGAVLCKICLGPSEDAVVGGICAGCRGVVRDVGTERIAPTEQYIHPATSAAATTGAFADRMGSAAFRPPPLYMKKSRIRRGWIAALAGMLLVGAGLGVVALRGDPDPVERHLRDVRAEDAHITFAVPSDVVVTITSETSLAIMHESIRGGFAKGLETQFDMQQRAEQVTQIAGTESGDSVEVMSSCRLVDQQGEAVGQDVRELKAYPWEGLRERVRMEFPATGGPTVNGDPPLPLKDVTPFVTIGALGVPDGPLRPGATWRLTSVLPVAATHRGSLSPLTFECRVTYVGRATAGGRECAVTRISGTASGQPWGPLDRFNRSRGKLAGALFHDLDTGLLVEAHLYCETAVWLDRGRMEERVSVKGRVDIDRR